MTAIITAVLCPSSEFLNCETIFSDRRMDCGACQASTRSTQEMASFLLRWRLTQLASTLARIGWTGERDLANQGKSEQSCREHDVASASKPTIWPQTTRQLLADFSRWKLSSQSIEQLKISVLVADRIASGRPLNVVRHEMVPEPRSFHELNMKPEQLRDLAVNQTRAGRCNRLQLEPSEAAVGVTRLGD